MTNRRSHKRKSFSEPDQFEKRETLSRRSKEKEVDYSGILDLRTITGEKPPGEKKAKEKPDKPRKEKKTKER